MKMFSFCIGNPPYQDDTANDGDRPSPIYDKFMETAYAAAEAALLITPARFLFRAGQTSGEWNRQRLEDEHFKVVFYEPDSACVFPGTDIKGGVAVTYRNEAALYKPVGVFTAFAELNSVLRKVKPAGPSQSLASLVSPRGLYRFSHKFYEDFPYASERVGKGSGNMLVSNIFAALPEVFSEKAPEDGAVYLKIAGRQNGRRIFKYIRRDYVADNAYIDKYKVVLPEANGAGAFGEPLSAPALCAPLTGAVDTFISFGPFDSREEAEALLRYLKSKFARALLGVNKVTQHNPRSVWRDVPLEDFSAGSDIDWKKPVSEIDRQLWDKYGLSGVEIAFIETHVREMK
ncbi:Eco57I restriction-modification methylase domain-containing protein [bacterium]|nr:Eco57I restriction-modification methylase domain-containing protein [bacterium]